MNTEFEMLEFGMEQERGARRGAPARAPRPPMGRTWPARPPAPRRPAWGGWRYPVLAPWPEPYPYRAPPDDAPYAQDDEPYDEVPKTIQPALQQMPPKERPVYKSYGFLRDAVNALKPNVAGLYLIEFTSDGRKRAYSGQAGSVRRRLQQHLLCATMLGLDVAKHKVFVAESTLDRNARRDVEKTLHKNMGVGSAGSGKKKPVLTNQRTEFEAELLGESWR
ncbi:hypothetical protein PO883_28245 [Massilia sp. DJPM01]|uniref:hypothetical protein n=1 Tax=Massilia sp. DJPM01 TaxID=3024404 RepID=UPI00259FCD30|nr:hypothetical protein [Massilia sp. DJPM01]MDM5181079.1 hypothetical protein [Massilia sp. DJPM01]